MKKSLAILLLVISALTLNGCKHDPDGDYYAGLLKLKSGNEQEAMRLFRQSSRNGSKYVARRSCEQLTNLGNVRDRLEACENLLRRYDDNDAVLLAAKHYEANEEYTKLLNLTSSINYKECPNQLAYLRLKTLLNTNDAKFYREAYEWFTVRPLSASHYEIYNLYDDDKVPEDFASMAKTITFRVAVYKRSYKTAYEKLKTELDEFPFLPQLISDFGKTCLYGSEDFYRDGVKFESILPAVKGSAAEFYVNFYAGRLFEKAGNYYSLAGDHYKAAMECAFSGDNFDNALWYLLNLNLKRSTSRAIATLKEYAGRWNNPSYFDDFFDTLAPILLSEGRWNDFYEIYRAMDGVASDEAVAKYAYIYGRLVQEKFALQTVDDTHHSEDEAAFTRALTCGSSTYYKIMAINQLGLAGERAEEILCLGNTNVQGEYDEDAEKLLLGYATYGLPEKIYSEWLKFYGGNQLKISYETGKKLALFLKECGDVKEEYYPQSLRVAARVIAKSEVPVVKKDLYLLYPRDFSQQISDNCKEYKVPEEVMYALIRSESFFDSQINSSAGATGLTQLMDSTASDVARKLKMQQYSLKDASQNIKMGTYYLSELSGRLDGDWLNAFYAYNAGITRVRRWIKSSKVEFNNCAHLPEDLFLETIPYEETREYGRKLVSATAMYGWLYYNKSISEVVKEIVK